MTGIIQQYQAIYVCNPQPQPLQRPLGPRALTWILTAALSLLLSKLIGQSTPAVKLMMDAQLLRRVQQRKRKRIEGINWGVAQTEVSKNGWFVIESPVTIDDLGISLFQETTNSDMFRPVFASLDTHHLLGS